MKNPFSLLMVILIFILLFPLTGQCASVSGNVLPDNVVVSNLTALATTVVDTASAFDVPEITIKAVDISTINEIEKDHVEVEAPRLDKETPIIQKNFVFSFLNENKEIPAISTLRPVASNGVNNIYAMLGNTGLDLRYLYGHSGESHKYFMELEHAKHNLGREDLQSEQTRVRGSLSSVLFDNKTELEAEYANYVMASAVGTNNKLKKNQLKLTGDMLVPFNERYNLNAHAQLVPMNQKVINTETQSLDWELTAMSKPVAEEDDLLNYHARLGHIGFAGRGLNVLEAGLNVERVLNVGNKAVLGLGLPFYWSEGELYSQIALTAQLSTELSESSTGWIKLYRGLDMPDMSQILMSDPYEDAVNKLKPQLYAYVAELGYNARFPDLTEVSCQLQNKHVLDPLTFSDINADGFPDLINGQEMEALILKLDLSKPVSDVLKLELHTDVNLAANTQGSQHKVPYMPLLKGWIGADKVLDKNLIWQNKLNFATQQNVDYGSTVLPGFVMLETRLKKEFARTFEGYLAVKGLTLGRYFLYDNIPGEVFSISAGFSMNF